MSSIASSRLCEHVMDPDACPKCNATAVAEDVQRAFGARADAVDVLFQAMSDDDRKNAPHPRIYLFTRDAWEQIYQDRAFTPCALTDAEISAANRHVGGRIFNGMKIRDCLVVCR